MALLPVSSSNSAASNNNQINNMIRQLSKEQETKVFKQSGGTPGLITGILPEDAGFGELLYDSNGDPRIALRVKDDEPSLKISRPGFDVLTADQSQLSFNSEQNIFKIVDGYPKYVTVSIGSGTVSVTTIPHGLDRAPIVWAFPSVSNSNISSGGQGAQLPLPITLSFDTTNKQIITKSYIDMPYVDEQNVYFIAYNATGTAIGDFQIFMYLIQETL